MRFFIDTAEFDEIKEAYELFLKLQTLLMDLLAQRLFPLMLKAWWRKHMTL